MTMGLSPIHLPRIRCYFKVQQPQKQVEIVNFKSHLESLPQHLISEVGRQSDFLRDVLNLSLCVRASLCVAAGSFFDLIAYSVESIAIGFSVDSVFHDRTEIKQAFQDDTHWPEQAS